MKISKSLLSAIAAGIVMTAATSCDKSEAIKRDAHTEDCRGDKCDDDKDDEHTWNCPACGMG